MRKSHLHQRRQQLRETALLVFQSDRVLQFGLVQHHAIEIEDILYLNTIVGDGRIVVDPS
ncbi:MAG: hypothetical protein IPO17_12850 [Flavobacteriales bacterium]|nr:hypothetical protein [Flavobacteriales bacterium]